MAINVVNTGGGQDPAAWLASSQAERLASARTFAGKLAESNAQRQQATAEGKKFDTMMAFKNRELNANVHMKDRDREFMKWDKQLTMDVQQQMANSDRDVQTMIANRQFDQANKALDMQDQWERMRGKLAGVRTAIGLLLSYDMSRRVERGQESIQANIRKMLEDNAKARGAKQQMDDVRKKYAIPATAQDVADLATKYNTAIDQMPASAMSGIPIDLFDQLTGGMSFTREEKDKLVDWLMTPNKDAATVSPDKLPSKAIVQEYVGVLEALRGRMEEIIADPEGQGLKNKYQLPDIQHNLVIIRHMLGKFQARAAEGNVWLRDPDSFADMANANGGRVPQSAEEARQTVLNMMSDMRSDPMYDAIGASFKNLLATLGLENVPELGGPQQVGGAGFGGATGAAFGF